MALSDIETIILLIMENRSFDHMLGYLNWMAACVWKGSKPTLPGNPASRTNMPASVIQSSRSTRRARPVRIPSMTTSQ